MNDSLRIKLDKIAQVFDIKKLQSVKADNEYIRRYYLKNKIPYSIFHTKQDFVHMGISRDGIFKEEDLVEHVRFVDQYLAKNHSKHILELATGRAANSSWLASKHPEMNFYGIDLSEGQLSFAFKAAKKYANLKIDRADFHNLEKFADNTFDTIFIIEALCHSQSPDKVMSEVGRVLKEGGFFIVFDGYLGSKELFEEEKVAANITARGMAVSEFLQYRNFKNLATNAGLVTVAEENLSTYVIPTMCRFEKLADRFFRRPKIGKIISRLLPQEFTYNAVSGMLMPVLFKLGVSEYWVTVFKNSK